MTEISVCAHDENLQQECKADYFYEQEEPMLAHAAHCWLEILAGKQNAWT